MIKSIILTALRNILRNRTFSALNLAGLSVGMSLSLLIILIIQESFTYDDFHKDAGRIYRVNTAAIRVEGFEEPYASTPFPLGTAISDEYSFAEKVVRINRSLSGDAIYGNVNVPVHGLYVDPTFLEVFNFPFEKGDPSTALTEPSSLVLTQEAAKRLFGDSEALGQTLTITGAGEFQVTGVLKKFISKTHLDFEVLGSTAAIPVLEKQGSFFSSTENWNNYYSNYVYFRMKEGHNADEATRALAEISTKHYAGVKLEVRDKGYRFYLHPLGEITPGPELSNQMGSAMPEMVLIFLGSLVAVVMLMACFNYTNLMIAKSLSRAREIGVRKIVGAQRFQVFGQFVGEAVIFSLVAMAVSYVLMQVLKPAFKELNIANEFSADLNEGYQVYLYFIAFAILIGLLAGSIPAGYLSSFKPVKVLKESGAGLRGPSKFTFRKILIVVQFSLSMIFITVVLIIYNQVDFMLTKDYGINEKDVMNIRLQGMEFQKLANEAATVPGVISVGGVSHALGTWSDRSDDYKRLQEDELITIRDFVVDANYISNLEMVLIAGRNFDATASEGREREVILNETALTPFRFADPLSAVGQTIYVGDTTELTVVGVVKDFNFKPLSYKLGPLVLRNNKADLQVLSLKIAPGLKESVEAIMLAKWKKLDPIHRFEMRMMEEEIDDAYYQAGFNDIVKVVGYVCFLAVTLACFGMLGMAMYTTKTRFREIGIRKAMGATAGQVTVLLSSSFLYLIGVAVVIGTPIGYFLGSQFISSYAYRITISPLLLVSGIGIIVGLGVLTIGSQTWKAAATDPVKTLRHE